MNSNNTRAYSKDKFKCFTCGTIFSIDGNIINSGKRLICPLKKCQSEEIRIRKNGYKCENCGSLLDADGKLIKKGKINIPNCPLKECGSISVRIHEKKFLCFRCGTIFNKDGDILKKGKRKVCALKECGSSRTWIKKKQTQEDSVFVVNVVQNFLFLVRLSKREE